MKTLKAFFFLGLSISAVSLAALSAFAISEEGYQEAYDTKLYPFLKTGARFEFSTEDGIRLSAVTFQNPNAIGTIVILPGRGESWVRYAETFYDLYQKGYSIFSYDHRGQGLSPHFVTANPQIDHVDHFEYFARDLGTFLQAIVKPATEGQKVFLLAHSMGGAVAADYLANASKYGGFEFTSVALSAPMLQINTKPYPEIVGRTIVVAATKMGKGEEYAPDQGDYDPNDNKVTTSVVRFWMMNETVRRFPEIAMGGPSNQWVAESIAATHRIRKQMSSITTPILLLQAGHDQLVKPHGQNVGCNRAKKCTEIMIPESQHEILNEKDYIRDRAFGLIEDFFSRN